MSVLRVSRLCLLSALGSLALVLTGCAFNGGSTAIAPVGSGSTNAGSGTARVALGGKVYGGQQPIAGAAMTLWAAGTSASYGTGATSVATTTTDTNGNFSFNNAGVSPCTTGQYLYITSVGGDPGAGTNQYAALMAALPTPCGPGTASTYVVVNEVTTVASVTALQQFMSITPGGSPAWTIGVPAANVTGLANAFLQVGNLAGIATGTSGPTTATSTINSVTYTTTITPDSTKINTLADILGACINTAGSGVCTSLFADTTPGSSTAPTDTIQAAYYLATNAGGLSLPAHGATQGEPYYLCNTYVTGTAPFQPSGACSSGSTTYPTDWTVDVNWTTSNGTTPVGTQTAASVAIDQSGNIWTSSLTTSTTGLGVTEFNPAGQVLITPATTAPVAGGWNYATCLTCGTAANLGGTKQGDAIAIDTNGNAWATSYYGTPYTIVTNQPENVVVRVTPGTGAASAYLVGSFPAGLAIDGSNNLYVGDDSSTTTNRWYEAELVAAGTTAYSTFSTGTGRTGGNGDYYIGASVDETPAQYVWPWSTPCQTTIPRITNTPSVGTASTVGSTTPLPTAACYIAADASGNAWVSTAPGTTASATALEYVNVGGNVAASIASPTVTRYTQGANGVATGAQLGGGLYNPQGMAIDGTGNLWVVNSNGSTGGGGISEFVPTNNGTTLTPLSPSGTGVWGFFSNTTIGTPIGAAIDGSGNVWFKTKTGSNLYYLVGVASPAVTPLSAMVKIGFIAERPGAQTLATLSPALSFSTVTTTSEPLTATLTNTGSATVKISGVTITGINASDFTVTGNTCGATLAIGANCSITVTFASTTAGTFSAALNVASNAAASPSVALTGTTTTAVPLNLNAGTSSTPTVPSITFPTLVAGSVSTGQTVVVANTGSVPLTLALGMSGAGANLFNETTNCGSSVAAGGSCNITLTFAPKVAGSYSAAITLTDNAGTGSQTIPVSGVATSFTITINTTSASDWKIDNGAISIDWSSTGGNIFGLKMDGYADPLTDTTGTQGFYMDNAGFGSGGATSTYTMGPGGSYLDWSITTPSSATNAYTYSEHFVVYPNDPGWHVYFVANHATTDIAGGIGQVQWVFRDNLTQFTNTYEVDPSVNSPGVTTMQLPLNSEMFSPDPGRAVQDATNDLHGFTDIPASFTRSFYTKYDHAGYEYLHKAHGLFGSTYGVWTVFPKQETMVGGPTKQDLYFTGNLNMIEAFSNHEDNGLSLATPAGTASSRLFGPFYVHLNTFGMAYNQTGNTLQTAADMYADALQASAALVPSYDSETQLTGSGYVASTGRGSVSIQVNGVSGATKTAWAVLSDPNTNFEYSSQGMQYWADISATGSATISGVVPGTYRLSVYVLGQWGEYRQDGIVVTANSTTTVPTVTFVPESFGTPVFTIGTPDRSSHEFLHGHFANGNDDREFWGAWNYWADFAANNGAVIYNATDGPAGSATNDLTKWNYNHPGNKFDPGLFGGVYNPSDDTTDGYIYAIPAYVAGLTGASGTNGVTTPVPAWQVHFATPASFNSEAYVVLSVAVACAEGSYTVNLNGQPLVWHFTNASDCMVRSGLSGYTQWFAMQWPASVLSAAGLDNVMTIGVSQTNGVEEDALRLELTNNSAAPSSTGWNDYTYVPGSTSTAPNDAVPNP